VRAKSKPPTPVVRKRKKSAPLEIPVGRKPKVQIAIRPKLAHAFRYIVKKERRETSDIFRDMLDVWISARHPEKYGKVDLDDEE
jgi:hypothetical protein